ncbi:anthranilate synthase component I [Magnetofaba australis]|uniref:anthranilate synthase component I n=1 Tax=Magnetofaba australis TaxID=1472297 RepID=UPI0018E92C35
MLHPTLDQFQSLCEEGNLIPVYREIMADLDTPVTAFLKVAAQDPHAFLLESVQGGEKWGRYSLIGLAPRMLYRAWGRRVEIETLEPELRVKSFDDVDPVRTLRELMAENTPVACENLPRFCGGAVGYLGYDSVRCFETIPNDNPATLETPDVFFMFCDTVLVFDNLYGRLKIVRNVRLEQGDDPAQAYELAASRIEAIVAKLKEPLRSQENTHPPQTVSESDFVSEMTREEYEAAVVRAKEYILAGDIMQVVLSQRLSIPFPHADSQLYRALRATNPSPYLFLVRCGDFSLVGSSPEILVRQEGTTATVRPIAGTRPRGRDETHDKELEAELLADPKERAEHLMLVDLGRNDLGRIAEIGTVQVTEQYVIERYSHVMHIVSNVEARLKDGLDAFDVVAATFPAGTVSGAPKIRAMEIIDELEVSQRGPYAGAVGYFSYSGHMDLAIAIRTAVIQDGRLYIQAGAGIVADSQPDKEWEETMNKARAIFRAVDLAQRGLDV